MLRSAASKVAWAGRTASMVFGLALVMALVVGVASMAFGANGGTFVLGNLNNAAAAVTGLVGNVDGGAALRVTNPNTGTNDTALDLRVGTREAPMRVNSAGKVANLNADKLDGKDFASSFGAKEVIQIFGPLPREGTYTSKGGTLLIFASGSGFRSSAFARGAGRIGMRVSVDGIQRAATEVTTNERDSHKAFVPSYTVLKGVPAGTHTIRLEAFYAPACNTPDENVVPYSCTTTDGNDFFAVTVVEIPD